MPSPQGGGVSQAHLRVRAVIVGKTHMGAAACVGAMSLESGASLRLLTSTGYNQPGNTHFEVGGIWDLEFTAAPNLRPPHVEDVLVNRERFVALHANLKQAILQSEAPWEGGAHVVFDRLVRATNNGSGYVSDSTGLPNRSTGYWISDRMLSRESDQRRYLYPSQVGVRRLTYVGFAPMLDSVPAGTLMRVSLARWWRPSDADDDLEERCYLQLSGWYL